MSRSYLPLWLTRQGLSTIHTPGALAVVERERTYFLHGMRFTERALFDEHGDRVTDWADEGPADLNAHGEAMLACAERDEMDREVACG